MQTGKLHEAEAKLRGTNVPTMEPALVVPAVRSKRPNIRTPPWKSGARE
jgi:hypothetical protein